MEEMFSINFLLKHRETDDDVHPVVAFATAVTILLTTAILSLRDTEGDTPIDAIEKVEMALSFESKELADAFAVIADTLADSDESDPGVYIGGEDDIER